MSQANYSSKLNWVIGLLAANLFVLSAGAIGLLAGFMPKLERATATAERLEARFQEFADEVQPVVSASAGKAIETIRKMDSDRLSESATEKTDSLLEAATSRAKRMLGEDKDKKN